MGYSDPGHRSKLDYRIVKEIVRSYTYVSIWMAISIAVIIFNKWLLAYSGFPFPIALTLWHMAFCSIIGFIAVKVLRIVKSHNLSVKEYTARVMPIGILYAGSLWLSNSSYLYLSISFIQMTKSLMPGLVYISGCLVGTEQFSTASALNMALIAAGVVVCALGEVNLVAIGLIQQLTALGFEALRLTLVQLLINSKGYNMNPLQSLYYVSPACFISLLLPFCFIEYNKVVAGISAQQVHINMPVLLANALSAFALNLAVFLLIGKTSALTMNIAGVIKDWMLIFFSYRVFKAPVTGLTLTGYIFCCSGVVVYNNMKLKAIRAKVECKSSAFEADAPITSGSRQPVKATSQSKVRTAEKKKHLQGLSEDLETGDDQISTYVGIPELSSLRSDSRIWTGTHEDNNGNGGEMGHRNLAAIVRVTPVWTSAKDS